MWQKYYTQACTTTFVRHYLNIALFIFKKYKVGEVMEEEGKGENKKNQAHNDSKP